MFEIKDLDNPQDVLTLFIKNLHYKNIKVEPRYYFDNLSDDVLGSSYAKYYFDMKKDSYSKIEVDFVMNEFLDDLVNNKQSILDNNNEPLKQIFRELFDLLTIETVIASDKVEGFILREHINDTQLTRYFFSDEKISFPSTANHIPPTTADFLNKSVFPSGNNKNPSAIIYKLFYQL